MCFKTANLPAPATGGATEHFTESSAARITVQAEGVRSVRIGFGSENSETVGDGATSQYFDVDDLRDAAAYFTKLADDLADDLEA